MTLDEALAMPVVPADHRIAYGADAEQFGDLYLPAGAGPHPVVVLLHGGWWRATYGVALISSLADALRGAGLAVWSVEYRRLGNGGGWPHTFADVARGIDFLRGLAGRFALDLSRAVAVGHSVGAHLALWHAGRHRLPASSELHWPEPLPLRGVVALGGVPDLVRAAEQGICRGACPELLGGMPAAQPARYAEASPHALAPLGVPQWHLVGEADERVPAAYVQQCVAAAPPGDAMHLTLLPGAGHFDVIAPTSPVWPAVRAAVFAALAAPVGCQQSVRQQTERPPTESPP